jgi:hypothetical protein
MAFLSKSKPIVALFVGFLLSTHPVFSQTTIWLENFSGPNQGWVNTYTAASSNCGNNYSAAVVAGQFQFNDVEGSCCSANPNDGGTNTGGEWTTNPINIANFCNVGININWSAQGPLECDFPAAPSFGCTGTPADNGHDQMLFEYSIDGGPWTQFYYVCGSGADQSNPGFAIGGPSGDPGGSGTASITGLTGNSIRIRIQAANKANDEFYFFDNVRVQGTPVPTVNPPADVTVCTGQNLVINFTGTGTPAPTFNWNVPLLGVSGSGNINVPVPPFFPTPSTGGIEVTPVSAGCTGLPQTFDVTVVSGLSPTLGTGSTCANAGLFNLNTLRDPAAPNGNFSGTGVSGNNFNPAGLNGTYTLTFTPTGACAGAPTTTTMTVRPAPTATFIPTTPVCLGEQATLSINFTGTGPWSFNLFAGATNLGSFTTSDNPFSTQVIPATASTTYSVQNFQDANCNGANASVIQTTTTPATGVLSNVGSNNICTGQDASLSINFSNGVAPYTFVLAINGTNGAPITTNSDPYNFPLSLTEVSTITVSSVSGANGCIGTGSGTVSINVRPTPTATLTSGNSTICAGQNFPLNVALTGTPPFSFVYSINGVSQPAVNTSNTNFTINAAPTSGVNTYALVSVSSSGCPGTVSGVFNLTVGTSSTAAISGSTSICTGQPANLSVDFMGSPPYTFNYTANGVAQPPVVTNNDPYTLVVTPSVATTYVLTSIDANGCGGTVSGQAVVTVGVTPSGQLANGGNVVCTGETDTLRFTFSGPGPYTFVYSINGVDQTPLTTANTTFNIPVSPGAGMYDYVLESLSGPGCPGVVGGTYSLEVTPPPTATLSGDATICAGTSTNLSIAFTGSGPFTVNYTANGVAQPPIVTGDNPYVFGVSPGTTTAYALTSLAVGTCVGTVSGQATVTVQTALSGVVSGGGQICTNGTGTTVTFTFSGPGPYTFTYTENFGNTMTVTTPNPTYTISVNPPAGRIYRLETLTNGICPGTVSGAAVVSVFTPPTAELMGTQTFCNVANTNLEVNLTGAEPFILTYSINGVIQEPDTTSEDPYFIPISVTSTTTYALLSIESPGCTGIIVGGPAVVTVNYPPSYANVQLTCNAVTNTYTVSFDVLNATLPLTLESGSGSFTGSTFTSTPIPQASGYNFVFHDANDCGDITVSGPSTCNCVTQVGTMQLDTLNTCITNPATATHNGGFVNDGNDELRFILHTNPALPLGTVFGWSATPTFSLLAGMSTNTVYYISAVAGNPTGNGDIDSLDICRKVSQGTPVIFRDRPTGTLSVDMPEICLGDTITVTLNFTGSTPFSFASSVGGVAQSPVTGISAGSYAYTISPSANTFLSLDNVSDRYCANGLALGASTPITVNAPPTLSPATTTCDLTTGTYTVSFTLLTGEQPVTVNGIPGSFAGNTFTSVPIPGNTPYFATISDNNNCGLDTIQGTPVCGCITDAGDMSLQNLFSLCQNQTLNLAPSTGQVLDFDDTLLYILHDQPGGNPIGNILAWSSTPSFSFGPGMALNTTYYVSAIAGNPDGAGQVDLTDPCLDVANGTPVQFTNLVATLSALDTSVCSGQPVQLTVNFTGTPPFSFTPSINGVDGTPFSNLADNSFSWTINPTQNSTVVVNAVSDQVCSSGAIQGTASINIPAVPSVQNLQTTCDNSTATYVLTFEIVGTPPFILNGNVPAAFNGVSFFTLPIPFGTDYSFTLRDSFNCGEITIAGSANCACPTQAGTLGQTALTLCDGQSATIAAATGVNLDAGDVLVYYLVSGGTNPNSWTVIATSSTPSFAFNGATMSAGTNYNIVAVAGNPAPSGIGVDPADPCISIAIGPVVSWRLPITASLAGSASICAGAPITLPVTLSGPGPYILQYTVNGGAAISVGAQASPFNLPVSSPSSSTVYALSSVIGAGNCPGSASGSATVTVSPPPQAVNVQSTCDFATETFTLTFNISNGAAPNSSYTVSGVTGTLTDTTFVSNPIPSGTYSLTISDATGCTSTASGTVNCLCTTSAGNMPAAQVNVCLPGQAALPAATGSVLAAGEVLQYILYQNAANLPQGVLATSNTPQFALQNGMSAGTTYFVAAIAGNALPGGGVDPADPCLSISNGTPVVFRDAPTATLMGMDTVCPGGNAAFQINFQGNAPFQFVYAVNGQNLPQLSAPLNTFSIVSNNIQADQNFSLVSVRDAFCVGTVSGQAAVDVRPAVSAALNSDVTICAGDTATLTLQLSGASTFNVSISGGSPIALTGVQNGATVQVSPAATTTYGIGTVTAVGNNCPATVTQDATVTVTSLLANGNLSNYNGFNVSCPTENDGSIAVVTSGGVPPITALWSNGASGLQLRDLAAGTYTVLLTDQIGCQDSASFTLTAPPEVTVDFSTAIPRCFDEANGSVTIEGVSGGTEPYTLTINDISIAPDTFPATISQLASGTYTLEAEDANGCVSETEVDIASPPQLLVYIGPDQTISLGDSIQLTGLLSTNAGEIASFSWSPTTFMSRPDSLATVVRPLNSQIYRLLVQDTFGCVASDEMRLIVQRNNRIFIPNIINPSSDDNNSLAVYAGPEVRGVRFMRVYDRWGELLFEGKNLQTNDPSTGWKGRARDRDVLPGVYVFSIELDMVDGSVEQFAGDVTVKR